MLKSSTHLSSIYQRLFSKQEDIYEEVHGRDVKNVKLTVEEIVPSSKDDEKYGIKNSRASQSGCERKCYVRFISGKVKNIGADGKIRLGDMEPNKSYVVSGSTFLDGLGILTITDLGFMNQVHE